MHPKSNASTKGFVGETPRILRDFKVELPHFRFQVQQSETGLACTTITRQQFYMYVLPVLYVV